MDRSEWELLRGLDRKLQFISKACARIEQNEEDIATIKKSVEDIQDVVIAYRKILQLRSKLRNVIRWIITIGLTAALTTFVNNQVNVMLVARDEEQKVPAKIRKVLRDEGQN